jgi:hypothetical protein
MSVSAVIDLEPELDSEKIPGGEAHPRGEASAWRSYSALVKTIGMAAARIAPRQRHSYSPRPGNIAGISTWFVR